MSDSITDLDALVPSPKKVTLGGRIYVVPGDIPMEVFIRVNKAGLLEQDDEAGAVAEMVGALTDLFAWDSQGKDNEQTIRDEVEKVLRSRGVGTISKMLRAIYQDVDETPEDDATPPAQAGTTTPST